jgi:3-deoxy-D-manno-octulosonic acid hydroxylase-like protein
MSLIQEFDIRSWAPVCDTSVTDLAIQHLEHGHIILLRHLIFELTEAERRFLSPIWADGRSKNINSAPGKDVLKGARGSKENLNELHSMIKRFAEQAMHLVQSFLPRYARSLTTGRTSFRPVQVEDRTSSYKKDDRRLHVDAFPSQPNHGERILRVFTNVHPFGLPRLWKTGEAFEGMAQRFLPLISSPMPGSAWLLHSLGITKRKRSLYDHVMLQLHNHLKRDVAYQRQAPQWEVVFPAQSTWMVFSDQVLHAAVRGQFLFEQTFHVPLDAMADPQTAPLRVLERLMARPLI